MKNITARIKVWMIVVALIVAAILCLIWWLIFFAFSSPQKVSSVPTAALTAFPFQTYTPTIHVSQLATSTPASSGDGQIAVGMFVQISGTGGDGLHIRSGPGINYQPNFIAAEGELLKVAEGPETADGFTWWYLIAPTDETRYGWAVSNYLSVIKP